MTLNSISFQRSKVGFIEAASGTGCLCTGSGALTVNVAAGNYWLGGRRIIFAGGTSTHVAASTSRNRIDVVAVDESGNVLTIKGTDATAGAEVAPVIPDDVLPLCRVVRAANDNAIQDADITDLRDFGGLTADGTTISVSAAGVLSVVAAGIPGFPAVVAANVGTTALTGNGAAQNIFTDTFTGLANGEVLEMDLVVVFNRTAGAGTSAYILSFSGTTVWSEATINDTEQWIVRLKIMKSTTSGQSSVIVERINTAATPTGTDAWSVVTNTTFTGTLAAVTLTANTAAATNGSYRFTYNVRKYPTGV